MLLRKYILCSELIVARVVLLARGFIFPRRILFGGGITTGLTRHKIDNEPRE